MKVYIKLFSKYWTGEVTSCGTPILTDDESGAMNFKTCESAEAAVQDNGIMDENIHIVPEDDEMFGGFIERCCPVLPEYNPTSCGSFLTPEDREEIQNRINGYVTDAIKSCFGTPSAIAGEQVPPARHISAILKDADENRDNYSKLVILASEVKRTNMLKIEKSFAVEHIEKYFDILRANYKRDELNRYLSK